MRMRERRCKIVLSGADEENVFGEVQSSGYRVHHGEIDDLVSWVFALCSGSSNLRILQFFAVLFAASGVWRSYIVPVFLR